MFFFFFLLYLDFVAFNVCPQNVATFRNQLAAFQVVGPFTSQVLILADPS